MSIKIVDVSIFQEGLKLEELPKDIKGVIIRCGGILVADGKTQYKDRCFESFYKQAKKQGLLIGAYYLSCANSKTDGIKEAKHCLKLIKGKEFNLPVYYDVEVKQYSHDKTGTTDAIIEFTRILNENGFRSGLYTNPDWHKNRIESERIKDIPLWLALWTNATGKPSIDCDVWQYGHIYVNDRMVDSDYILNERIIENMEKVYTNLDEIDNVEMKEAVGYFIKKDIIKTDSKGRFNINQTKLECVTILYRVLKKLYIDM